MSISKIELNKDGGIPKMQITVDQNHEYTYKVDIQKFIDNRVVLLKRVSSKDFTSASKIKPFSLRLHPKTLTGAQIIWEINILPQAGNSNSPYTANVRFTQDDNLVPIKPSSPPPPHKGNLKDGQAVVGKDVIVKSAN